MLVVAAEAADNVASPRREAIGKTCGVHPGRPQAALEAADTQLFRYPNPIPYVTPGVAERSGGR
jgi:hypothetical protein